MPTTSLPSQDGSWVVGAGAVTEFADLLRQTSDRYLATAFLASSRMYARLSGISDTIELEFISGRSNLSINNRTADIQTLLHFKRERFFLQWSGLAGPLGIKTGTEFALVGSSIAFGPFVRVTHASFDSAVVGSFAGSRTASRTRDFLDLQDFTASFDERISEWTVDGSLRFRPLEQFSLTGVGSWTKGRSEGRDTEYGLEHSADIQRLGLGIGYRESDETGLALSGEYGETRIPIDLTRDKTGFGGYAVRVIRRSLIADGRITLLGLPFRPKAGYAWWAGSFTGHVESWPFTPLAASIFQNRLNARGGGRFSMFDVGTAALLPVGAGLFTPAVKYVHAESDFSVERWEPEFLVFGVKNYRKDRIGFESADLMVVEFEAAFPLFGVTCRVAVRQIIPLVIRYASPVGQAPAPAPGEKPTVHVDGGRWYYVSLVL